MRLGKLFLIACFFLTLSSLAQAPLDFRIALVIGNAAYVDAPALGNSTNDARSVASVLRKLGFQVIEIEDGSKNQIEQAVSRLQALLQDKQAVAMLYYAGHGLQLDWHNYMVPVDVRLRKVEDVPKQTIDIDRVIASFKKASTRMNIIVLDACRDNPFSGKVSGKGLAQIDAPVGTYLAFATAPGNVAEDGDESSGNGLFTRYFLKELQRPATIEDMFKRVRLQVRQKSQGRQIPWDSSSLEEDFSFNDGSKHTFDPEDLVREARAREEKLKAEVEAAKQRQARIDREQELEWQRLVEEKKNRDLERRAQIQRDLETARQREIEAQRAAEAKQLSDLLERQKAQAQAEERERQLAQAAKEEALRAAQAEAKRNKAEVDALEKEKQLALAAAQEKEKVLLAALALENARAEEAQKAKELQAAKLQAAQEAQRLSLSRDEAIEKQFEIEKADWDKIKDSKNADDFYDYLNKYPTGLISQQANFRLENLAKAKILSQPDRNGLVQRLGEPRFREGDSWVISIRDDYSGDIFRRISSRVKKIENGLVYIDGDWGEELRTLDGGVIHERNSDRNNLFDPPRVEMPGGEFQVGKKWTTSSRQTNENGPKQFTQDIKITALEKITIPAGDFWAYKFEAIGWSGKNKIKDTYWCEPNWGVRLKWIRIVNRKKAVVRETYELESMSRGPQSGS